MIKKIQSIIIIVILIYIGFIILSDSSTIMNTVSFSINLWINNIFPSLFPFFILSEFLINYGFVELLAELSKPIMTKIFNINPNCSFIFIMSMLSGFPSNSKYTKELYEKGIINKDEASKILTFTHFSNPLFILGTVSVFLNNKKAAILILVVHYLTNIIIGIIFRNYNKSVIKNDKISIKKAVNNMHNKRINNSLNFGSLISKAITDTISTLLLILGTVTIFLIISTILISKININPYFESLIKGIVEMTQGIQSISLLNIPIKIKSTIIAMILSFGGISVHMQVKSIISDTDDIEYKPFLTARLLHSSIAGIIVYYIFSFIIN